MDFKKLRDMIKRVGAILVMNGNEPEFVVLSYDKYRALDAGEDIEILGRDNTGGEPIGSSEPLNYEDQKIFDRLNQEILALKEEIRQKESAELLGDEQSTEQVAEGIDLD
jgi:hypothetical protein